MQEEREKTKKKKNIEKSFEIEFCFNMIFENTLASHKIYQENFVIKFVIQTARVLVSGSGIYSV